jgi:hypothetical protein
VVIYFGDRLSTARRERMLSIRATEPALLHLVRPGFLVIRPRMEPPTTMRGEVCLDRQDIGSPQLAASRRGRMLWP